MLHAIRNKAVSEFTHEDITDLQGIYNALKDGEITIESLLSEKPKPTPALKTEKGMF